MEKKLIPKLATPGFGIQQLYEYLLVVRPAAKVYEQIKEEKESFCTKYNVNSARKILPHITVANFLAGENMEATAIRYMHRIFSMQKSFGVTLNNYSGIPPHTVYLRIYDHLPFRQLAASLSVIDQYVQSNGLPPVHLITHPHLTVARRLEKNIYEKAIFEYSQKIFHASFEVTELVLLKRQAQFDNCKEVSVFKLHAA